MDNIQLTLESSTTSLSLNSDSIYLNPEIDGLAGLPEIRTTSGVNAGYNGGWTSAQFYDARLITIRGVISNSDISVVEDRRKALVGLLGQGRKEELTLHFVTAGGNSYVLNCRTISCEMALSGLARKQEFLIQLRADDPLIYDDGALATEAIVNVRRALGGFQIDFGLPLYIGGGVNETLVENGNETVYPVINLYGPLHSPTIINQTTNQQMQVLTDLDYTLTWVNPIEVTGDYILITNETDKEAPLADFELKGNTVQNGTPTPDAPVAVQTTTGENVVKITGKNLVDSASMNIYSGTGITITHESDGSFTINGTLTSSLYNIRVNATDILKNLVGETVTLSVAVSGTGNWRNFGIKKAGGGDLLLVSKSQGNTKTGTFTANAGGYVFDIYGHSDDGTTFSNFNVKLQCELGSTASDFEPYQSQSYEVNLGKNLFNKSAIIDGNYINSSGTETANDGFSISEYISVEPNMVYAYSGSTNETNYGAKAAWYDGSKTWISSFGFGHSGTITAPASARYVRFSVRRTAGDAETFQLEIGSTATTYAAYFTPIELCKLGTYQDRIYKDGDDWKIEKHTGKVVIDGSITPSAVNTSSTNTTRVLWNGLLNPVAGGVPASDRAVSKCDHFGVFNNWGQDNVGIYYDEGMTGNTWFRVNKSIGTTSAEITTWLSNNPVSLYYIIATPTTTTITNQALIDQLEAVGASQLFVGQNNLVAEYATGNAQGELSIDYFSAYTEERDIVVIDSQARTITKNGADIYYLKADGSEFPTLAPGENTLYLTSEQTSDEGYAEIKFKQGYLSI